MTANNDNFTLACDALSNPVPVMGVGPSAMLCSLDHFERLAVYSAHMKVAHRHQELADEARAEAAKRGLLWQRCLKRAMLFDRQARVRFARAKIFLHNTQVQTCPPKTQN